jgi:hypothetical protein
MEIFVLATDHEMNMDAKILSMNMHICKNSEYEHAHGCKNSEMNMNALLSKKG